MNALTPPLVSWGGFFGNADLVTSYVAIITAVATGVWGVRKYAEERRSAREQQKQLAETELEQRKEEAHEARQQRAAELIKAVGDAADARSRRWTMSALSLYPDESLDLLLTALGEASVEDASAIKMAVISLGQDTLPKVVKYHRIAVQICTIGQEPTPEDGTTDVREVDYDTASRMQDCTREILVHLLLQLDDDRRREVDLAGVDLSGVNLSGTRLTEVRFRKVRLDGAILGRAKLREANLRGATLAGTVLTRAQLMSADLTGVHGSVQAVRADLSGATLDQADLSGSTMDAARFQGASMKSTKLVGASLAGANLGGATLERTRLMRATAHHVAARNVTAKGLDASKANLADARVDGSTFENSKLVAASAPRLQGQRCRLVNVNLGGANLEGSDLSGSDLTGCVLGGTHLSAAILAGVAFTSCTFGSTRFAGATLAGAQFRSCVFKGRTDLTGVDLSTVELSGCRFDPDARLVIDNATWQSAKLDPAAKEAFGAAGSPAVT